MGADFHFHVSQITSFERRILVGVIDVGLVAVGIDVVGVAVVGVTEGLAVDVAAVIALSSRRRDLHKYKIHISYD